MIKNRPKWEVLIGDTHVLESLYTEVEDSSPHPLQEILEDIIAEDLTDGDRELYYMRFGERRSIRSIAKSQGFLGHQIVQYRLDQLFEKIKEGLVKRGVNPTDFQ